MWLQPQSDGPHGRRARQLESADLLGSMKRRLGTRCVDVQSWRELCAQGGMSTGYAARCEAEHAPYKTKGQYDRFLTHCD